MEPHREAKSISAETTFETDIGALRPLEQTLYGLAEEVSARLKRADLSGRAVTLKLKTADFRLRTRSRTLDSPTCLAGRIYASAHDLLVKEADGTRFRLIGVGVSELEPGSAADPADLVDPTTERLKAAESAMDALAAKFGRGAVSRGLLLDSDVRQRRKGR